MHNLVVVVFDSMEGAERCRQYCQQPPVAHLVDSSKMVVAVRDMAGQVHLHLTHTLAKDGAFIGGIWGTLVGLIFLNPLLGVAAGAGVGAAVGELSNVGIGKGFMTELANHLKTGTSALFIPAPAAKAEEVTGVLRADGEHVLNATLTPVNEAELEQALEHCSRQGFCSIGKEKVSTVVDVKA